MLQYMPPPPPLQVKSSNCNATRTTSSNSNSSATLFASLFSSATASAAAQTASFTEFVGSINRHEPTSLCLSTSIPSPSIFSHPPPSSPHMSATALLQKAAQIGSAASPSSFLRGLGLASSSVTYSQENNYNHHRDGVFSWSSTAAHHNHHQKLEHESGLGLGLPYESGSGLPDLMMGSSSLFGAKPATLDLLGLGIGPGGSATGGLSALMSSIGSGLDMGPGASTLGSLSP